jgi:hypothetical protein
MQSVMQAAATVKACMASWSRWCYSGSVNPAPNTPLAFWYYSIFAWIAV